VVLGNRHINFGLWTPCRPTMASSIAFPVEQQESSSQIPSTSTRPPHLPFRRISLPTPPHLSNNRFSIVSVSSFESPLEEDRPATPIKDFKNQQKARTPTSSPYRQSARQRSSHQSLGDSAANMEMKEKRRKVINELIETERAYVNGLDLIYTNFLIPLISSLETPQPLLDRAELTSLFSNFIDIWNLHRSFFTSLTTYLTDITNPPPVSPVLMSHFPYLSLYTPFVTSFPTVLTSLSNLMATSPPFAQFIITQEADPRCGKLGLRDWLLTIVQRCPRYLLLLKDLINCTDRTDPEYRALTTVYTLLSKITQSLNTSLHEYSQTLDLLALQRATPNLPFQLITPGRSLIRRGSFLQGQVERSAPDAREFLLFSDCLVWLAHMEDHRKEWVVEKGRRPRLHRGRSRSETELPTVAKFKRSISADERWSFKGKIELVDVEAVISPAGRDESEGTRFDILSPEISFAVYTETEKERDEWVEAIRNAKSSLMISLNLMHQNSTLTSSEATTHLRRALQALPDTSKDEPNRRRGHVDHFLPAVWVPDSKTDNCMRCSSGFGWRRRRHHCRLCGRCVCSSCSGKTFFISDSATKERKAARACNVCYETVFPIVKDLTPVSNPDSHDHLQPDPAAVATLGTLSKLPWQSVPAFDFTGSNPTSPSALLRPPPSSFHEPLRPRMRARPVSQPILTDIDFASAATSTTSVNLILREPIAGASLPDLSGSPPTEEANESLEGLQEEISEPDRKRFSAAALAVDTQPVTARPAAWGEGRNKRFSLLLSGRSSQKKNSQSDRVPGHLDHGPTVGRLTEILGKYRKR